MFGRGLIKGCGVLAVLVGLMLVVSFAGAREFTSKSGSVMEAELVSHKAGKVTIRRDDGKEFEVDPSIFAVADEQFIRKWMELNPETVSYNFSIEADRKKVDGQRTDYGYKLVKNKMWMYEITILNQGRDAVKDLTIEYKVLYSNAADGAYSASSYSAAPLKTVEGSVRLKEELGYNRELVMQTKPVTIDDVNYSGTRYRDELIGCLLRILDPQGKVVVEWASKELTMKGRTWENSVPHDSRKRRESKVIVR